MPRFTRLIALACFCLAFGFMGSIGGTLLMAGHLKGDRGPAGPPGASGPAGPQGPVGVSPDVGRMGLDVSALQMQYRVVRQRLDAVEGDINTLKASAQSQATDQAAATQSCLPSQVVTDVSINRYSMGGPTLNVQKSPFVCLPMR